MLSFSPFLGLPPLGFCGAWLCCETLSAHKETYFQSPGLLAHQGFYPRFCGLAAELALARGHKTCSRWCGSQSWLSPAQLFFSWVFFFWCGTFSCHGCAPAAVLAWRGLTLPLFSDPRWVPLWGSLFVTMILWSYYLDGAITIGESCVPLHQSAFTFSDKTFTTFPLDQSLNLNNEFIRWRHFRMVSNLKPIYKYLSIDGWSLEMQKVIKGWTKSPADNEWDYKGKKARNSLTEIDVLDKKG